MMPDFQTTLGEISIMSGDMRPKDLLEIFDGLECRRGANERAFLLDGEVRRYFAGLLRDKCGGRS
jgi:hypothetical protein